MRKWLFVILLLLPLSCFAQERWELVIEHDTQVEVQVEEQQGTVLSAPTGFLLLYQYYEIEVGLVGGPYEIKRTDDVYYLYDDLEPGIEYEARARMVKDGETGAWSEWVQVQTLEE